jgi:hypothetical protein
VKPTADQLVHTYSIVARDAGTGQIGVAVQSHYFGVFLVAWAEAGVVLSRRRRLEILVTGSSDSI